MPMLTDATYNLMETITVLSKGLHRYDTFKKDSKDCQQCAQIWDYMRKADDEQLKRLATHLKQHMDREQTAGAAAA
jgi:hypothetical protein